MNIIIPLGGLGSRFKNSGYSKPKPLINALGQPIIYWLLNSLDLSKINNIIIPYNSELEKYRFEDQLKKNFSKLSFIFKKLEKDTRGASETLFESIKDVEYDSPILCIDGDNFFLENIIEKWQGENCVYVFESNFEDPIYSYSKIENNKIIDIKEKDKISKWASAGVYGFDSSKLLKQYCEKVICNNIKEKNEFYTSVVIKEMIKDETIFRPKFINQENMICLGTPNHLKLFCNNYKVVKPKRYCFDLDNTLVTYPKIKDDYSSVLPIEKNIKIVRMLKNIGNEIIIYTARRMKTHDGNIGKINADIGKITINTLEKFNIPYDELYFGKPYADFYIDDLAISAFSNLEKELGIYDIDIKPRCFNQTSFSKIETFKKESDDLSGEVYYYKNIPEEVKDLFPLFIKNSNDNRSYEIEKINGIPISNLYLSEELNEQQLDCIIDSIKRLHDSSYEKQDVNLYANYSDKLIDRFQKYDYSKFSNCQSVFNKLNDDLINYEKNNQGIISVVHGDPVFTNILLDKFGKIKFIDMRGKLGNDLTILGDSLYDWAKLYQSLVGYDEILQDVQINNFYKASLINFFETRFLQINSQNNLEKLKLITKSLLFSLIPLHNNDKCKKYYNLLEKL